MWWELSDKGEAGGGENVVKRGWGNMIRGRRKQRVNETLYFLGEVMEFVHKNQGGGKEK